MENHVITTDIVTKYKVGLSFDHITFNSFLSLLFDKCETESDIKWLEKQISSNLESTVQNRLGGLRG